jgi:hypothetical protein
MVSERVAAGRSAAKRTVCGSSTLMNPGPPVRNDTHTSPSRSTDVTTA